MTDKALTRSRVLRTVPEQCCGPPRGCCAGVFSPQHEEPGVQTTRPQPLAGGGRHSPNTRKDYVSQTYKTTSICLPSIVCWAVSSGSSCLGSLISRIESR